MSYLRDIATGAVSVPIDSDSKTYRELVATGKYEDVGGQIADAATTRFAACRVEASAVGADNLEILTDELENDITVTSVTYTPDSGITGADTNSRTISVLAGPDKASPISVASLALTSAFWVLSIARLKGGSLVSVPPLLTPRARVLLPL